MDREIWKPVNNYEGMYEVSNRGRVRSINRWVTYSNGRIRLHKGRILEANQDIQEYNGAVLSKNGKTKRLKASRLVAIHFIPNPNNYNIVNHIDGNKKNDNVRNLEWCTQSYNNVHAFRTGLRPYIRKKHTKYVGVSFHNKKYEAFLYRNSKNIYIGVFNNQESARQAIKDYKNAHNIAY